MKLELEKLGHEIHTQDILPVDQADYLLFLDIPKDIEFYPKHIKKAVIITESEVIKPQNWDLENHKHFDKIFTWHSSFIDNKKYFKLNFSNKVKTTEVDLKLRENFCCLIAGAKKSSHPFELYSERVRAIEWFEQNHPQDFQLYGPGWDKYQFSGNIFFRAFNKIKFLTKALAPNYKTYRGLVKSKLTSLRTYQFNICYENAHSIPGYITEKIFDAFFAGCIPVYLGPPDIDLFVPKNSYIDKNQFRTYEELYQFMKGLSLTEIQTYQKNILSYLNSEQAFQFTGEYYAKTVAHAFTSV
ncbi:hypothetical protein CIK05_07105 [Bdellovibrio sp. qaytius]|nr:hypothetical protein CIK05_07105 [Bdellovibrio sp. qaytius]